MTQEFKVGDVVRHRTSFRRGVVTSVLKGHEMGNPHTSGYRVSVDVGKVFVCLPEEIEAVPLPKAKGIPKPKKEASQGDQYVGKTPADLPEFRVVEEQVGKVTAGAESQYIYGGGTVTDVVNLPNAFTEEAARRAREHVIRRMPGAVIERKLVGYGASAYRVTRGGNPVCETFATREGDAWCLASRELGWEPEAPPNLRGEGRAAVERVRAQFPDATCKLVDHNPERWGIFLGLDHPDPVATSEVAWKAWIEASNRIRSLN